MAMHSAVLLARENHDLRAANEKAGSKVSKIQKTASSLKAL